MVFIDIKCRDGGYSDWSRPNPPYRGSAVAIVWVNKTRRDEGEHCALYKIE